eukprot:8273746-Heterocapsa_arctica.AAC.1
MLYMSLQSGLMQNPLAAQLVAARMPVGDTDHAGERAGTGQEVPEMKAIRNATKNTLELVTTMLSDPTAHRLAKVIVGVLGPLDRHHSEHLTKCKTFEATCNWYTEQAAGAALLPAERAMALLSEPTALHDMGVVIGGALPGVAAVAVVGVDHPAVVLEDHFAAAIADACFSLAAFSINDGSWH